MIAAVTVVLVTLVLWSAFSPRTLPSGRRAGSREGSRRPGLEPDPVGRGTAPGAQPQPYVAPVIPPETPSDSELSYIDQLARAESRRRIRASAGYTYLDEVLAASGDSSLRRWDDRNGRPIRVYVPPGAVEHFQPDFLDAVRGAFETWVEAGVPLTFNVYADSVSAEIVVRWTLQFGIDRTGQTDLVWDRGGRVVSGVITIATLDPNSKPLASGDVRVVALHEVGHVLGLDHSADSSDIMFARARVRGLSDRDIRTVMLLYQLAPGSVR
jgi:hypothetical protein